MRAAESVREELRENAADVTRRSVRRSYRPLWKEAEAEEADPAGVEEDAFEPWVVACFADLIQSAYTGTPFALLPCLVNDKPSACIALTRRRGRQVHVHPVFVAVTDDLTVTGRAPPPGRDDTG